MSIPGEYVWKETKDKVIVKLHLHKCSAKHVDVFAADLYVKISYKPRLVELDLVHEVDEDGAVAKIKDGHLVLTLPKKAPGLWGALVLDRKVVPKAELRARREGARERRTAREGEIAERARDRKQEDERTALRKQMKLDEDERTTVEDKKATEKQRAEEDVYESFKEMKVKEAALKREAEVDRLRREAEASVQEVGDDGGFDLDAAADAAAPPPPAPAEDRAEAPPEAPAKAPPKAKKAKAPPAVRGANATKVVEVTHTPRVFPTPMRESKLKEENDWVSKNRAHLHKNKMLFGRNVVGTDGRGVDEADPTWLKSRADHFYRGGDFLSAEAAYSAALELDPEQHACLGNRAACYLKLDRFADCVADCDRAAACAGATAKLKTKVLARRGAACCGLGDYDRAARDFAAAADLADAESMGQKQLRDDAARAGTLGVASAKKRLGDAKLGARDAAAAEAAYTAALDVEPTFVSALANRAAARLANGDATGAVADCTAALDLFETDEGDVRAAGPVPPVGSDQRRTWVLRTLARRGAAHAKLGDLSSAVSDYETAAAIAPDDAKLAHDLAALKAKEADAAPAAAATTPASADLD